MNNDEMDQELRDAGFTDDQIAQAHVPISATEMDAHEEAHKDDADRQYYRDRDKKGWADYHEQLKGEGLDVQIPPADEPGYDQQRTIEDPEVDQRVAVAQQHIAQTPPWAGGPNWMFWAIQDRADLLTLVASLRAENEALQQERHELESEAWKRGFEACLGAVTPTLIRPVGE